LDVKPQIINQSIPWFFIVCQFVADNFATHLVKLCRDGTEVRVFPFGRLLDGLTDKVSFEGRELRSYLIISYERLATASSLIDAMRLNKLSTKW
jgi:hypothetical protein